jgi:hypothetical protein
MLRQLFAAAFVLTAVLVPSPRAQSCAGGQSFFKNDVLPANPGQQAVSVIQGLCEGEAAGCVFNVTAVGTTVKVKSAAIGYVQAGGVNGTPAAVNLKIYDGITFPGGIPALGPQVFDFSSATGGLIGVTSSGINSIDLSQFDIPITSGKAVITWWMEIQTVGSCAQGHPANFATDYPTGAANCNVQQKNLIYILGQGWRDASTASVQGFTLCPLYYAGNWLIRACMEPAGSTVAFCFGDGSLATPCPCGNLGAVGRGCENSVGTSGAILTVAGTTNPDTMVMTSSGELPSALSIFLQGNTESTAGLTFGDGVRCVNGALKRLYVKSASGGVTVAPVGGDLSITARSAAAGEPIPPGGQRFYQVYYRDPNATFCPNPPGNTWNVSSGMKITW